MSKNIYNILMVLGSIRSNRKGIMVARWLEKEIKKKGHNIEFVDLKEKDLPIMDKRFQDYDAGQAPKFLTDLHKKMEQADGFIFITPEYNHAISSALKNFLDYFFREYFFKPAALSSYSTGATAGIRALENLKLVCSELGMITTTYPFTVAKVDKNFKTSNEPIEKKLNYFEKKLEKFTAEFEWYLEALKVQRKKGLPF